LGQVFLQLALLFINIFFKRGRGMRNCESLEESACGAFQHLNTRNLLQLIQKDYCILDTGRLFSEFSLFFSQVSYGGEFKNTFTAPLASPALTEILISRANLSLKTVKINRH
jgi:hypothetical protein